MKQCLAFYGLWMIVASSLLACQPIRPETAATTSLSASQNGMTPCRLTVGQRLGDEQLAPRDASARLDLAGPDEAGERLVVTGVVYAADCQTPLTDAMLEVWQADAAGEYGNLQGTLRTDADGRYEVYTVKPGYYAGEANPPPLHIHLRIDHPNAQGIETEFFFADDPRADQNNPTFQQLSITLQRVTTTDGAVWQGVFPIVLADK